MNSLWDGLTLDEMFHLYAHIRRGADRAPAALAGELRQLGEEVWAARRRKKHPHAYVWPLLP